MDDMMDGVWKREKRGRGRVREGRREVREGAGDRQRN